MARRDTLDSTIDIVTPENILFHYRLAGPFLRLPAYLIDLGIRLAFAVATLIGFLTLFGWVGLEELGLGITLVLWFLTAWFYGGYFETTWNGQTPGKRLLGLRVLTTDGLPINVGQAVMRNVLRVVDSLPVVDFFMGFYVVGLLSTVMNRRYQRLGDLACSTMVVIEERKLIGGVAEVFLPGLAAMVAELPEGFQPNRSLAGALANYASRRAILSPERRKEIADVLGPVLAERFGLPRGTDSDLLLCAVYCKTFGVAVSGTTPGPAGSPFANAKPLAPEPATETPVVEAMVLAEIDEGNGTA